MIKRLLPLLLALILICLILYSLHIYRRSTQELAQQHNLQHLRLIETVASSLENRLLNMQAAYAHYASLIEDSKHFEASAHRVTQEIEATFSTVASRAAVLEYSSSRSSGEKTSALQSKLDLDPSSAEALERTLSTPSAHLLFARSHQGESFLLFVSPLRRANTYLTVVVPFERLIETYHLSDFRYDEDYVWVLNRNGILLYHRHHPEMIGKNIFRWDMDCSKCHLSFELEKQMTAGRIGYGINEVPRGAKKIVAYAPLKLGEEQGMIAVSESLQATTTLAQNNIRDFTLIAILLSLVIFASGVYVTRANQLRHQAEQEALHWREERRLQQQLERKHQQWLEAERFATVGRMAAQVAHEIKNPLSSISLNTELLIDEFKSDGRSPSPEAAQLTQSILSEIDLLTNTIDEYLQFARFPKLQKELISLSEIFEGLRQLLQEESSSRSITLQFVVSPSVPKFTADSRLLRQALLNLLRNSLDALGTTGWIHVEAVCRNGDVQIEVRDNGPGIAPENLPMLFEPFFTTKPRGTGLGLPLTRHIVVEHGGLITYEPPRDGGSKFVIHLPIEKELTLRSPEGA